MKKFFFALAAGVVLGAVLLHTNVVKLPITRQIDSRWAAEAYNDNFLVGFFDNIFVATVAAKGRSEQIDDQTVTAYDIVVIKNIKGDLSKEVRVFQPGGYKNGVMYVEDEAPLMQVGETYLLAGNAANNQLIITSFPGAHVLLDAGTNHSTSLDTADLVKHPRVQSLSAIAALLQDD